MVVGALARGQGGSMVIAGPAGIGKSALLRAITTEAHAYFADEPYAAVAMVAATEAERDWPYSGLHLVMSAAVGATSGEVRDKYELRAA
ncbi:ATP-binding protein, partial [Phytoactinopolyspora endophytica]|uniref:ATP-binding protein n=1 Tax=Phytoactinopolyspora endophytica TaxID=1642495 RepID=UPI0013EABA5D